MYVKYHDKYKKYTSKEIDKRQKKYFQFKFNSM